MFIATTTNIKELAVIKARSIEHSIKKVIEEETVKQVKEYVREVVDTVAKERIAAAVDRFSAALCYQLDKIAAKTNWYLTVK